jgi:hypothetical protein
MKPGVVEMDAMSSASKSTGSAEPVEEMAEVAGERR